MSWSFTLLLVPTICYGLACAVYGAKGNWAMAVVYFGYSLANCGLLALDRELSR